MIYQKDVICRGFTLCCGSATANETLNAPNIGGGKFNHYVYVYLGGGVVGNGVDYITMNEGALTDISKFAGAPIQYKSFSSGGIWVAINPVPDSKRYDGKLLKGPHTEQFTNEGKEKFIICFENIIQCNGVNINPHEYVRVLKDSVKNIFVPEGAVAAVFTERK
jgi:hypothetical protein